MHRTRTSPLQVCVVPLLSEHPVCSVAQPKPFLVPVGHDFLFIITRTMMRLPIY